MIDEPAATRPHPEENQRSWARVWTPRIVWVSLVTVATGVAVAFVFWTTRSFLMLLLLSLFLAFALEPAVSRLARRGWRRGAAAGLVLALALIIGAVFVVAMVGMLTGPIASLLAALPGWVESIVEALNDGGVALDADAANADTRQFVQQLFPYIDDAASVVLGIGATIIGAIFQTLTIGLFVFYLLADAPRIRRNLVKPFPPHRKQVVTAVWDTSLEMTGSYVYSRSLLAGFSAAFHTVAFLIIGLPSPLALGLFVGVVSQFVPNIGTFIASALPIIVALSGDPIDAVWVLIAVTVYQQFENIVLANRITAETMNLHPAVAFGSVIVGASMLGAVGALMALPAAATIQAFISSYLDREQLASNATVEASAQAAT